MGLFDSFFGKGKVLYFPGCTPKYLDAQVQKRHEQLLKQFEIDYITLPKEEVCCGRPALDYGYVEDFNKLQQTNTDLFQAHKIKKIITSCPSCYYTFKKKYEDLDMEIEHISQTILDNIDKIQKKYEGQKVTFFDPCNPYKLPELYDNPRKILETLGLRVVDLPFTKEKSLCCGKSLQHIAPKVGTEMANAILKDVKTRTLITTSTDCCLHFKETPGHHIKIRELSEVLL